MNKKLIATTVIGIIIGTGAALNLSQNVPISQMTQSIETIKVIHQSDGKINIVNPDGLGILITEEDFNAWINSDKKEDNDQIEELRQVAKNAAASDQGLKDTKTIEAHYEKNIITQTK